MLSDGVEAPYTGVAFAGPAARMKGPEECTFVGFEAYAKVLQGGVDGVLLAIPPGCRP